MVTRLWDAWNKESRDWIKWLRLRVQYTLHERNIDGAESVLFFLSGDSLIRDFTYPEIHLSGVSLTRWLTYLGIHYPEFHITNINGVQVSSFDCVSSIFHKKNKHTSLTLHGVSMLSPLKSIGVNIGVGGGDVEISISVCSLLVVAVVLVELLSLSSFISIRVVTVSCDADGSVSQSTKKF